MYLYVPFLGMYALHFQSRSFTWTVHVLPSDT